MRKNYAKYIPAGILEIQGDKYFQLIRAGLKDFLTDKFGEFAEYGHPIATLSKVEEGADSVVAHFDHAVVTISFTNYLVATVSFDDELELRDVEQFIGTKSRHYDICDVANTYRSLYDFILEYTDMSEVKYSETQFVDDIDEDVLTSLDDVNMWEPSVDSEYKHAYAQNVSDSDEFDKAQLDEAATYDVGDKSDLLREDDLVSGVYFFDEKAAKKKAEQPLHQRLVDRDDLELSSIDEDDESKAIEEDAKDYEVDVSDEELAALEDVDDELDSNPADDFVLVDDNETSNEDAEWIEKPVKSNSPEDNEWDMLDATLANEVNPKHQNKAPYTKKPGKNQGKKPHLEAKTLEGNKKKKKKH